MCKSPCLARTTDFNGSKTVITFGRKIIASEMTSSVKVLTAKPYNLSSILKPTLWKERADSGKLSTHTHTNYTGELTETNY